VSSPRFPPDIFPLSSQFHPNALHAAVEMYSFPKNPRLSDEHDTLKAGVVCLSMTSAPGAAAMKGVMARTSAATIILATETY